MFQGLPHQKKTIEYTPVLSQPTSSPAYSENSTSTSGNNEIQSTVELQTSTVTLYKYSASAQAPLSTAIALL